MAIQDIYNCLVLENGTALSGMPAQAQCPEIREAGYRAVINLAPEDSEGALRDEAATWSALGLSYVNIPVPWDAPAPEHLEQFVATMDRLSDQPLYIHCQANFRVTAFYALYAMDRLGWGREQAEELIDRIWTSRPDYRMDDIWRGFIEAGIARIESRAASN